MGNIISKMRVVDIVLESFQAPYQVMGKTPRLRRQFTTVKGYVV